MNQKIIIGLVIVILIGGGAFWYFSNRSSDSTIGNVMMNATPEQNAPQSLKALMAMNSAQECTFQDATDTATSQGTVYFGTGKMRGDFVAVTEGQTFNSHMIVQGTDVYVWTDGMNSGFKTSVDETAETQTDNTQTVDFDKQVDYKCNPWAIDNGRFELPTNVTFNNFGTMMQQQTEAVVPAAGIDCSVCDQAPEGPARERCQAALGC